MFKMAKCRLSGSRVWVCLSVCAVLVAFTALSADAGLFDFLKRKNGRTAMPAKSLVLFPLDEGMVTGLPEGFGLELSSYLRSSLAGNPEYAVFLYSQRLSPIKRGLDDNTLKSQDIEPPFADDKEKSLKLAQLLASDYYLVGTVEDYEFDAANKTARMLLSAELHVSKTGKLVGQYLVAGVADETSKAAEEDEYRAVAAGKAVEALKASILPGETAEEPAVVEEPVEEPAAEAPAAEDGDKAADPGTAEQ